MSTTHQPARKKRIDLIVSQETKVKTKRKIVMEISERADRCETVRAADEDLETNTSSPTNPNGLSVEDEGGRRDAGDGDVDGLLRRQDTTVGGPVNDDRLDPLALDDDGASRDIWRETETRKLLDAKRSGEEHVSRSARIVRIDPHSARRHEEGLHDEALLGLAVTR